MSIEPKDNKIIIDEETVSEFRLEKFRNGSYYKSLNKNNTLDVKMKQTRFLLSCVNKSQMRNQSERKLSKYITKRIVDDFWDIDQILNFCLENEKYQKVKVTNSCKEKERLQHILSHLKTKQTNERGKKKMSEEKLKENKILLTGMISGNWSGTNEVDRNPMPKDYLSESNLPKELIEDAINNGWTDNKGNVYFDKDYQPKPVKHENGDVHLVLNDQTPESEMTTTLMPEAFKLLDKDDISFGEDIVGQNLDQEVLASALSKIKVKEVKSN